MIDNTSSIDSGSLSSQIKVNAKQKTTVANISTTTKTDVIKTDQVVAQVKGAKATEQSKISPDEVKQVVENLNTYVKLMKSNVTFAVDKDSGGVVISVSEAETQKLIRQIPSEEALKLLKRMNTAIGLIFNEKV